MKKDLKHTFDDFLTRDMDRREFLAHIGAGALALVGISNLAKLFGADKSSSARRGQDYGAGAYGGQKREV